MGNLIQCILHLHVRCLEASATAPGIFSFEIKLSSLWSRAPKKQHRRLNLFKGISAHYRILATVMAKLAYVKVAKILHTQIYTYMTRNVKTNHVSANYATYVNYIMVNIFSSEYSISVNLEKSAH